MEYQHIVHPFLPLYREDAKILILGSLPSVKSREEMFFYGHKQNRFWKVLSAILLEDLPESVEEKREMVLKHKIAMWDTIYSCDIIGSSDASIKNVIPTDLNRILEETQIRQIFCNGKTSGKYFQKYQEKELGKKAIVLPSTSPANAAFQLPDLIREWSVLKEWL